MNETTQLLADRAKEGGWWNFVPDGLVQVDQSVFDALKYSDATSTLHEITHQLVHRWPGMVLIVLLLIYLFRVRRMNAREILFFLFLIGVGNLLSDELKILFGRLKPHVSHDIPGGKQPLSFPSNHSVNTATVLGFWLYYLRDSNSLTKRRAIILLTLVWAFTAWSRVYLGEHFPLDVLGGLVFGLAYGIYGAWLLSYARTWLGKRKQK